MGSNIEPEYHIPYALKAIDARYSILAMSEFIYTEPLLYTDQEEFLNGSVMIETTLSQEELIAGLKEIEDEMQRDRTMFKNGPRKIDLDLIVYEGEIVDDDVYKRDFLKNSVLELLPELFKDIEGKKAG